MSRFSVCCALLLALPAVALADEITVSDGWIRLPPPGSHAAAYMTLRNDGTVSRQLTGVKSQAAQRIELHQTVVEAGVARMHPIEAIEIPAGGEVVLAPRGLHLMLFEPAALKEGDEVELVLELDGDESLAAQVRVRRDELPAPSPEQR